MVQNTSRGAQDADEEFQGLRNGVGIVEAPIVGDAVLRYSEGTLLKELQGPHVMGVPVGVGEVPGGKKERRGHRYKGQGKQRGGFQFSGSMNRIMNSSSLPQPRISRILFSM